jgi:hypothetical protein
MVSRHDFCDECGTKLFQKFLDNLSDLKLVLGHQVVKLALEQGLQDGLGDTTLFQVSIRQQVD